MRSAIAIAVLLSACTVEGPAGPSGPQGPIGPAAGSPIESGTRIKMRVGTTPDGAKLFLGWHDAELGVDCEFRLAADGKTRCLPVGPSWASSAFFRDSNCELKAAVVSLGEGARQPKYVSSHSEDADPWGSIRLVFAVYSVTGQLAEGPVFKIQDGNCVEAMPNSGYLPIEDAPPADFAELVESAD